MKIILPLLLLVGFQFVQGSVLAGDAFEFPSPDGRFAVFMGTPRTTHYDTGTATSVTDVEETPAVIIERGTRRTLLELETPLRADADRVLWSADSGRVAVAHRAGRQTETKVFFRGTATFTEVALPDFTEPKSEVRTRRRPRREENAPEDSQGEGRRRLDHDTVLPRRWLRSGSLVLSRELCIYSSQGSEGDDLRKSVITVGFNTKREASVLKVASE